PVLAHEPIEQCRLRLVARDPSARCCNPLPRPGPRLRRSQVDPGPTNTSSASKRAAISARSSCCAYLTTALATSCMTCSRSAKAPSAPDARVDLLPQQAGDRADPRRCPRPPTHRRLLAILPVALRIRLTHRPRHRCLVGHRAATPCSG